MVGMNEGIAESRALTVYVDPDVRSAKQDILRLLVAARLDKFSQSDRMNPPFEFQFRLDWKHHRKALQQALHDTVETLSKMQSAARAGNEEGETTWSVEDFEVALKLTTKPKEDVDVFDDEDFGIQKTIAAFQPLLLFGLEVSTISGLHSGWAAPGEGLPDPQLCNMKVRSEVQDVLNAKVVGILLHPPVKLRGWSRRKQTLSSSLSRLTRSSKGTDAVSLPDTCAPTPSGTRTVAGSGATGSLTVSVSPSVPVPPTFQRTFGSTAASGGVPSAVLQPDGPSEQWF